MEAIDRLPEDCKALLLDYLSHPALRRLGSISQVGLSVYPQQTRLQHTLESLALAAEFIRKAPSTTSTVRRHLVAAVALEDTGRAPFSNSLEALFTNLPGLVAGQALDVQRSILVVKHLRWDREVPESLRRLRLLIREGQLQVAELRQRGTSIVDLQNLQLVVTAIRDQLLSREHRWLLWGEDLPRLQVYHPGSISVSHKGRYRDLAETPELSANPDVVRRMRRSPLVVFPTAEFGEVQFVVHEAGLVLQNVVPLDGIRRLLESSDFGSSNPTAER